MTNKEKHKKLWMWLAEHAKETLPRGREFQGTKFYKETAFKALEFEEVENHCFACVEAARTPSEGLDCITCPCEWEAPSCCSYCKSIYVRWRDARTAQGKKKFALKIANCWR